jgi:hypothetical protein
MLFLQVYWEHSFLTTKYGDQQEKKMAPLGLASGSPLVVSLGCLQPCFAFEVCFAILLGG